MPPHISLRTPTKFSRARRIILKAAKKKQNGIKLNYAVYVQQVLNEALPDMEITPNAMEIINIFLNYVFERIAIEASRQAQCNEESKINTKEIQNAVLQVFQRGDLALYSMRAGLTAVRKCCIPHDNGPIS
jgi:histone H2B